MKIFLLKDIPNVGKSGELIKVSDGFAKNYIVPNKLGVIVTSANESFYANKIQTLQHNKDIACQQTSALAQKIEQTSLSIAKKMDEHGKMYGSVSASEIVELLASKSIVVSKSQIEFEKSVKTKGTHSVTIKLSSRLRPQLCLKVIAQLDSAR